MVFVSHRPHQTAVKIRGRSGPTWRISPLCPADDIGAWMPGSAEHQYREFVLKRAIRRRGATHGPPPNARTTTAVELKRTTLPVTFSRGQRRIRNRTTGSSGLWASEMEVTRRRAMPDNAKQTVAR